MYQVYGAVGLPCSRIGNGLCLRLRDQKVERALARIALVGLRNDCVTTVLTSLARGERFFYHCGTLWHTVRRSRYKIKIMTLAACSGRQPLLSRVVL